MSKNKKAPKETNKIVLFLVTLLIVFIMTFIFHRLFFGQSSTIEDSFLIAGVVGFFAAFGFSLVL